MSLTALGQVGRVEREEMLVRGDRFRDGGRGRVCGVYSVLLRSTRKPDDESGQTGSVNFLMIS